MAAAAATATAIATAIMATATAIKSDQMESRVRQQQSEWRPATSGAAILVSRLLPLSSVQLR